jgi:hypothetical protein
MSTFWDGSWDRKRRYDRRSMSFPAPSDTKTSYARTRPTGAVPCDDGLFHIAQLRWQLPDALLTDSLPGFARALKSDLTGRVPLCDDAGRIGDA